MAAKLVQTNEVQDYLKLVSGLTNTIGKARVKQIVHRIVSDLFQAIEDLEITPEEFWTGVSYINDLGAAGEAGLLAPGLGLEHLRHAPGCRRRGIGRTGRHAANHRRSTIRRGRAAGRGSCSTGR